VGNLDNFLDPGESITCSASYSITQGDIDAGSVTNTATASAAGTTSNQDSETAHRQYGALLPTQTTCEQYAAGPGAWPAMYDAFTYQAKAKKINSVSPGVIFYYNTITAPSSSFTLNVVQTNTLNWKPMLIQDLGQAILYNGDCNKADGVTVSTSLNPYTVTFNVTGATPGATYYIGIKYSPQNLIGQSVQGFPTSIYEFSTTGYPGSTTSIPVKSKK
ncbi:MAG TPA: hypothetical protein VFO59_05100, partial [Dehalococcoidia bacterium]|nr:hypothetical protein [Dehalococcoidia bacterium]